MRKLFGLIGKNISYSLSEKIAHEIFLRDNIDAEYQLFDIDSGDVFIDIVNKYDNLVGVNVTIPYKSEIIKYLNKLDEDAAAIGAVNCVSIERSINKMSLRGFNTDYKAFVKIFNDLRQSFHHSALILGTGGASKAVAYSFSNLSVDYLYVSRSKSGDNIINYEQLKEIDFSEYNIIINATPCGTVGYIDNTLYDFPFYQLIEKSLLIDFVYNPSVTPFMEEGIKHNCIVENGMRILQMQAELFYKEIFK